MDVDDARRRFICQFSRRSGFRLSSTTIRLLVRGENALYAPTMMTTDLDKYLAMKTALLNEKARLEARLNAINKVLGGEVSVVSAPTATRGGKRTFSAATKAKMAAAQKARWAKLKGKTATPATATATPSAPVPKKKRKMSAAGKANIRAAVKARWAKVNAAKAKTGK
jgi:hypothetical protein